MDEDFKEVQEQFQGLDMESLIEGPLRAASEAQTVLDPATAEFIEKVGLAPENRNTSNSMKNTDGIKQKSE